MKRTLTATAFTLAAGSATAHPGHGQPGWFHKHQDDLIDAAMIAGACLVAIVAVRLLWKVLSRP